MTTSVTIAVLAAEPGPEVRARAESLSGRLGLPLVQGGNQDQYRLLLAVTQARLELRQPGARAPGPVFAEFVAGPLGRRRRSPAAGAAMLARAVGFKRPTWRVVDATAGLARDAILLACQGCRVTAVERSAAIAAVVADGLDRASADPQLRPVLGEQFRLVVADSRAWLAGLAAQDRPDAVYLDPMFPSRGKSALARKEMRLCRLAAGDDADAAELLEVARAVARSRVAVKRSLRGPPLAPGPAFSLKGATVRYDIYLPS